MITNKTPRDEKTRAMARVIEMESRSVLLGLSYLTDDLENGLVHCISRFMASLSLQESLMFLYHRQTNGPAIGIFQIEPDTASSLMHRYGGVLSDIAMRIPENRFKRVIDCLHLMHHDPGASCSLTTPSIIIARLKFFSTPCSMDFRKEGGGFDEEKMASTWKKWYNTSKGRGTEEEFLDKYRRIWG